MTRYADITGIKLSVQSPRIFMHVASMRTSTWGKRKPRRLSNVQCFEFCTGVRADVTKVMTTCHKSTQTKGQVKQIGYCFWASVCVRSAACTPSFPRPLMQLRLY